MDAESYLTSIDNHSSCCMTNKIHDFIHPITPKSVKVKGFSWSEFTSTWNRNHQMENR